MWLTIDSITVQDLVSHWLLLNSAFDIFFFQMESELERFHKQNTSLELNITELRLKLKATDKEMHQERQRVSSLSNCIKA